MSATSLQILWYQVVKNIKSCTVATIISRHAKSSSQL